MKKVLFCLFLFCLAGGKLYCQEDNVLAPKEPSKNFPISAGPFLLFKGGVSSTDTPDNIKNGFAFNGMPDIGATVYFPITKRFPLGATLDLAYSTWAYQNKRYGDESKKWTTKCNYFTISPNFYYGGFLMGFSFGIPLGGTIEDSQNFLPGYTIGEDIKSSALNVAVEFHLGAMIPVYYDDFGRVNILIQGGIFLTNQFNPDELLPQYSDANNPRPAAASIGLSYLFNIADL